MSGASRARLLVPAVTFLAATLFFVSQGDARRSGDPVVVSVTAPRVVAARARFLVSFEVNAHAGALAAAGGGLRLRARLEPECGGSFAGTIGPKIIDRVLPAPEAGGAFAYTARAAPSVKPFGPQTVCAFVEDADQRQFATSTDVVVTVSKPCTRASRKLLRLRKAAGNATKVAQHPVRARRLRKAAIRRRKVCKTGSLAVSSP